MTRNQMIHLRFKYGDIDYEQFLLEHFMEAIGQKE